MSKNSKRPALFIDRDGTINRDCPYCHEVSDLFIYEDAVTLIRDYAERGFLIIVVTNQSGIGRGLFTVQDLEKFNAAMKEKVRELGGRIDDIYYCPHLPESGCSCRKPATGMIMQAVSDHDIDLSRSVVAGDRDDIDGELARRLGIPFILVRH